MHGGVLLTPITSPEGIGGGRKPPLWLKDGDVAEVGLKGVGTCVNRVEFI